MRWPWVFVSRPSSRKLRSMSKSDSGLTSVGPFLAMMNGTASIRKPAMPS